MLLVLEGYFLGEGLTFYRGNVGSIFWGKISRFWGFIGLIFHGRNVHGGMGGIFQGGCPDRRIISDM